MGTFLFSKFSRFLSQLCCGGGSQLAVVEGLGQGLINGDCEAILGAFLWYTDTKGRIPLLMCMSLQLYINA